MKKTKLLSAAAITASIVLLLLIIAASIPYRIDRLLLQEDGIVCSSSIITTSNNNNNNTSNITNNNNSMDWTTLLLHTSWMDYILMRFLLHVFRKTNNNNNTSSSSSSSSDSFDMKKIITKHHPSSLHPICTNYREIRSTIQQICIPWNWYRSKQFRLRRLTVRSSTVTRGSLLCVHSRLAVLYDWESFGASYCIHLESPTKRRNSKSDDGRLLPPAIRVRSANVKFRSWTKPVISAQINGVEINIVVQKGKRRLLSSFRKLNGNHHPDAIEEEEAEDKDAVSVLIGDMTIREAMRTLPDPPEREGMYPMIGLVNVTNVTVNVMERVNGREDDRRRHSLYPVNRIEVPDEIFAPLLNLTWANQVEGLDRFHFNSHLESAFSDAFRRHLFNEAEKALHTSMTAAMDFREMILEQNNKLHEQFRALVEKTQQLYIDKWLELGIGAIRQTKEGILHDLKNVTAPLSHAFRAWSQDVQNVISDSKESPLKVVMMHHWDQIMNWIDHHEFTFTTLQPSSKGLHPTIWSTIHTLASRSKDSIDELVATCEDEIRDMWMAWHLQFMPVLE